MFGACSSVIKLLPKATLAAILFVAAVGLIEWDELHFLAKQKSPKDILLFLATFAMCFFMSLGQGILLCLLFATFLIVKRSTMLNLVLVGGYISFAKL